MKVFPRSIGNPGAHRGRHPLIAAMANYSNARALFCKRLDEFDAIVGRSVVNDDNLGRPGYLLEDRAQRTRNDRTVIEIRHNDRERHASSLPLLWRRNGPCAVAMTGFLLHSAACKR